MNNLMARIAALQLQLQDLLMGMTPRDRNLLLGLVITGLIGLVGGAGYGISSRLSAQEELIRTRERTLQEVRVLAAEYGAASEQAESIKEQLRNATEKDLTAFLDKSTEKLKISEKLNSVKEKSGSANNDGVLEEKVYAVSLSKLNQKELAEFLYEIETSDFPLQIQSMQVKTRKRKEELTLRIDLDISTYSLVEGDEG